MNMRLNLAMPIMAIAFAILHAAPAGAEDASLSLADAQHKAIEYSRQLAAKDSAVRANREMAVAAGQLPDPVLKLGIDNLPVDGADRFTIGRDFMTQRRIGIMQEFTRADKRQLRARIYEDQAEKSLAEKTISLVTIQTQTALAWLDRYYAEAMATAVNEQINAAKLEIAAAEENYRVGRGSQADVFAAHSSLAMLDDRMSELHQVARNAISNLARWMGDGADRPLAGKPDIHAIHMETHALAAELEYHPQIALLTSQLKIAETEAQLAQANKKSDWSAEVSYSQRGSDYSNMVSIGVSVPLQWDQKSRQDRELASKLAIVEQARAEREEILRDHIGEVAAMVNEWQNGRERLTRYQQEILPLALERTRATLAAYKGGKATLSEMLLAHRNELDVRLQALQLEKDTARLWAQLNFIIPQGDAPHRDNDKDIQ